MPYLSRGYLRQLNLFLELAIVGWLPFCIVFGIHVLLHTSDSSALQVPTRVRAASEMGNPAPTSAGSKDDAARIETAEGKFAKAAEEKTEASQLIEKPEATDAGAGDDEPVDMGDDGDCGAIVISCLLGVGLTWSIGQAAFVLAKTMH